METLLSIGIGLGLAAACGLRVFLPLLGLALAAQLGQVQLGAHFGWLGSWPAVIALGSATIVEVAAYYIPWLDHALDVLATPLAVAAGILATGAVATDLPPMVQWAIALIAGGGVAGVVQGVTVLLRLKSTAATGGVANSAVATAEVGGSALLSGFAILVPLAGVLLAAGVAYVVWQRRRAALRRAA